MSAFYFVQFETITSEYMTYEVECVCLCVRHKVFVYVIVYVYVELYEVVLVFYGKNGETSLIYGHFFPFEYQQNCYQVRSVTNLLFKL